MLNDASEYDALEVTGVVNLVILLAELLQDGLEELLESVVRVFCPLDHLLFQVLGELLLANPTVAIEQKLN